MSTSSDGSQFMMDDDDDAVGFEGEAQISGGQKDSNKSKVESVVSANAENCFAPNGDMDLISEIVD